MSEKIRKVRILTFLTLFMTCLTVMVLLVSLEYGLDMHHVQPHLLVMQCLIVQSAMFCASDHVVFGLDGAASC